MVDRLVMGPTSGSWSARCSALTEKRLAQYSTAALRIVLGVVGIAYYVADYGRRHYLFGPSSVYPADLVEAKHRTVGGFSLYLLTDDPVIFDVIFHLAVVVAVCLLLGAGGRFTVLLHWVFIYSAYDRNPMLIDGGDNIAMIVLLMLALTDSTRKISLDAWLRSGRPRRQSWVGNLAHNAGVLLIMGQICVVYFTSGAYKMQGEMWYEGTALYYALQIPEFYFPGVSDLFLGSDFLLVTGAYAATLLLVLFPALVINRVTRRWVVLAMVSFHTSIALLMGLTSFALTMIACDLLFVEPEVRRAYRFVEAVSRRFVARTSGSPLMRGRGRRPVESDQPEAEAAVIGL